jgi:TPR repeat protein
MFVSTSLRSWWLGFGCLASLVISGGGNAADPGRAKEGMVSLQDVAVVDCLLPGQVRQLGSTTYLTQRRPIRTDAADCRTRGGEYVAYDRADYKSALKVWMAQAKEGDPEAQTTVGEIFERGLGGTPDYPAAVIWYQKVVDNPKLEDKARARALFDLGTLYEQGLGVEKDQLTALNLYRRAWGAPADDLVYKSAADQKVEDLRASLSQEIADRDKELQVMQKQLQVAEQQKDSSLATMQRLVAKLQAAQAASAQALQKLPPAQLAPAPASAVRAPASAPEAPPIDRGAVDRSLGNFHFGRYYALIIGNQNYDQMESLKTPLYDAVRAGQILRDKYGFTVQIIQDGTGVAMLKALNELNAVLTDNDNLLIYYAGHGYRLKTATTEAGYWLPRNADRPPNDTFWVPNEQITANIGRLKAKRVLVVADSCYAGLLSDDPFFFIFNNAAQAAQAPSAQLLQYRIAKRARLLIASGGDNPVLDENIDGKNSVFAKVFLDILESNQNILTSPALFNMVQGRVKGEAAKSHFSQQPEMKAIKGAGHEAGDFFFVPKGLGKT